MSKAIGDWFFGMPLCILLLVCLVCGNVGAQNTGKAEYEVYRCQHKSAVEVERLLKDLLPDDAGVHLVVDTKLNTLLLRGDARAQRIAAGLLKHVDRAPPNPPAPSVSEPVVQTYRAPGGELTQWTETVRTLCGERADVRITSSAASNLIVVLAPPEIHDVIAQRLQGQSSTGSKLAITESRAPMAQAASARTPDRAPFPMRRLPEATRMSGVAESSDTFTGSQPETDQVIQLRQLSAEQMEQRLLALFGRRLQTLRQDEYQVFQLAVDERQQIEFKLDWVRNILLVRGPYKLVRQFRQLVDAFDTGNLGDRRIQALHVERAADSQLHETIDAYRGKLPAAKRQGLFQDDQSNNAAIGGARLVNYLFQQQPADGTGADGTESLDSSIVPSIPGLNDLEVQTLPDLDVIILRGRDQDVQQLTKIIRELERISAETIPKIEIYWLEHTQSEAIQEIIDEVEDELTGRRQGRVSVTPLIKPNALLLIGWGEAVEAVVELIDKLDRPVPPESQFAVFPLEHAAVLTVQQTVTQFFSGRQGLGPRVEVASDARTNSLIVYAAPRDMEEVRRLVGELDVPASGAVNRAQIFRVYNALATDVATTLQQAIAAAQTGQSGRSAVLELLAIDDSGREVIRSGMLSEVSITPNPRNNTLIVTGPPEAMELISAFIEQLDTPGDRAQIKVFRVINGDATNLVTMLRSLIPSQIGQAPAGPQLPTDPEEESLAPLRFSVEVRSNSIIAVGSEGDLRIVEALLTRLDQSESMDRKNAVYLLKNSPAIDVAVSINEFLRSQRTLEAAEPGQSNPFQDLEREVIVVPEPVGNRLIVSATPRYFDEITQLIEKLDEPPPQVVIQVLIAEIALGDQDEFGVELGVQDSVLFDRSLLGDLLTTVNSGQISDPNGILTATEEIIQSATNLPGYDFNNEPLGNSGSDKALQGSKGVGGQALSSFALGRTSDDAGYGGLVLGASSRNVSILIRALQEDRETRILSRPLVRTLDNQPAFIQVGQRVPRIIGTSVGINGQTNQISLENVGLILGVTPRIGPDGNVVMEIDAEKSKVGPEDEGIPVGTSPEGTIIRSPRVDTITAQATVAVADGETVVLGGMISTEVEIVERRAPYLADVPVLGHLFRYDQSRRRRVEMLIILTPRVIRGAGDAERIKQAEFARMSWCAADVYELYGDVGIDFQTNLCVPQDDDGTEVIYPDLNPRGAVELAPGELPAGNMPTQELYQGDMPDGFNSAPYQPALPKNVPPPLPPLPPGAWRPGVAVPMAASGLERPPVYPQPPIPGAPIPGAPIPNGPIPGALPQTRQPIATAAYPVVRHQNAAPGDSLNEDMPAQFGIHKISENVASQPKDSEPKSK